MKNFKIKFPKKSYSLQKNVDYEAIKKDIENVRKKIDFCDEQIFFYLKLRFLYCEKIGLLKSELNLPIKNNKIFKERRDRIINKYGDEIGITFIKKFYNIIHKKSCDIQKKNKRIL